jgi:adenosylmethionine-8-amino-7-oxononanoate aminotransferase
MSVGYSEIFHHFHLPLLFPVLRINPPHIFRYFQRASEKEALEIALREAEEKISKERESLAALIVEPLMQGAAGMWSQPHGYVKALSEICRKNGILLILDEVATAFGRTGKMFACDHDGVSPDLLCLAKGITGGYLPLAATLTTEEIFSAFLGRYDEFKTFFHGHTYTGNPLGCAVALASLDLFRRGEVLKQMQPKIHYVQARLERDLASLAHVSDVRQWGFMVGIELIEDKGTPRPYPPEKKIGHKVILEARKRGVIIRPLGNVIVLMPPLSMTEEELKSLFDVTRESIKAVTEG